MEPSSTLLNVSSIQNLELREGQKRTIQIVASGASLVVAQLPTGYGKTLTALCSYAELRSQGKVNRLLYICPRRNQARQAEEIPAELKRLFGISTTAIVVAEEPTLSLRRHRQNTGEVFIATIQSLARGTAFAIVKDMMQTGRWMIVVDEHHHYSDGQAWADSIKSLSYEHLLAMSATPKANGEDYFPTPNVVVQYQTAFNEGAVKKLELHEYEYVVDVLIGDDNDVVTFTTGELFRDLGETPDDVEDAMVKRKMRWSPKYISPLITYPAERMADLRLRGIRSQMIVQAMSCSHAEMVCKQVKSLLPTLEVDWVGTGSNGRPDKENDEILSRFCPPKINGRRRWTLDVLVNVGMAGEGLDTVDVTEIVILTPANVNNSLLQLIGRASRRMTTGENKAYINIDTDSALSQAGKWSGSKIMGVFDGAEIEQDPAETGTTPHEFEYTELPPEPFVMIANVELKDIRTDPTYEMNMELARRHAPHMPEQQLTRVVERAMRGYYDKQNAALTLTSTLAQLKDQVDRAAGKIAGLAAKHHREGGLRVDATIIADLKRRINTQKKRLFGAIDDCDIDGRQRHYQYLRELEQEILQKGLPQWLR